MSYSKYLIKEGYDVDPKDPNRYLGYTVRLSFNDRWLQNEPEMQVTSNAATGIITFKTKEDAKKATIKALEDTIRKVKRLK